MNAEQKRRGSDIGYCPHCGTKYFIGEEDLCISCGRILETYNEDDWREDR